MTRRTGYLTAGLTLVGGMGLAAFILFQQLQGIAGRLQQIVVPGQHEITFDQAGSHTIFHEERAVIEGRYFAGERELTGLRLRLDSIPAGNEIAIEPSTTRASYSLAEREGSSIATFQIPHPGTYRLTAWYSEPAPETTAVLAIGHGIERRLMTAVFGALTAAFGGLLTCAAIAVATYRRSRGSSALVAGEI